MLHVEKQDSGTGKGCNNPGGTVVLSLACIQVVYKKTNEVTVSCALGHQVHWNTP